MGIRGLQKAVVAGRDRMTPINVWEERPRCQGPARFPRVRALDLLKGHSCTSPFLKRQCLSHLAWHQCAVDWLDRRWKGGR